MSLQLRNAFDKELNRFHRMYDEKENMLIQPFSSPGYHTTLKGGMVHSTRESLKYAVALLDSGEEKYLQRAVQILKKVISLQDTDPGSKTYGIWSWFLEEPLAQMSPPDWNWADFCGKQLIQVAVDHFPRLEEDVKAQVKDSIIHACHSIIRRNVGPGYTNISLMGTYVTHVAGELFEQKGFLDYAKQRLTTLHEYNMKNRAFSEYNSPTYTVVAIEEISGMLLHVKAQESLKLLEDLNIMAWECLARHFHFPTHQWAGPHARSYRNILSGKVLSLIQIAAKGRVVFLREEDLEIETYWIRMALSCPEKFYSYFTAAPGDRVEKKIVGQGNEEELPELAYCYLTDAFALSSFNRSIFWNQRRPLLGYFGTAEKPTYVQIRCLHDGYDFCSGHLYCIQEKGCALGVVNFYTDGGDTHPNLDMVKDAAITAKDLRLRLELGGSVANIKAVERLDEKCFRIRFENLSLLFYVADAVFGDAVIRYETGTEENRWWVDVVFYQGVEKKIHLHSLEKAYAAFAVKVAAGGEGIQAPQELHDSISLQQENGTVAMKWNGLHGMRLEAPIGTADFKGMLRSLKGRVDGIPYEQVPFGSVEP